MDTFSIIRDAVAKSAADPDKVGLDYGTQTAGQVIKAVQSVVDVLTPADGGRYIVCFADIQTAATSLGERRIIVSSKPLRDPYLSIIEKAVVIATFAAHEIGHTVITAPRKEMIAAHNAHSGYHAVANLADDIILEPWMLDRYPILADAFEFTGLWVLRTTATVLPKRIEMRPGMSTADRFNVILSATRYADGAEVVFDGPMALAERDWARDWKRRLIEARVRDHATFLALCDEMWDRVREIIPPVEEPPAPEPPPITCGPEGPTTDGPDEGGDEPPDEGGDEPGPDDGPGGDEPGGDEPTDEPPTTDGPTQPGNKGDEPDPDKVADPNDQPRDWDDEPKPGDEVNPGGDEPGDEPGEEPKGEEPKPGDSDGPSEDNPDPDANGPQDPNGEGGGGNSQATSRDEDDFDPTDVDKTTHEQAESHDFRDEDVEQAVRKYDGTTVTSFGHHGSLSTQWD